ncbi:hypothetical protein [Algoriphagus zhangzhouensis]|uniref:Phosphate-selective porin O and P n=1 Tax=Algoriphagus zhangzhouensis TaxID=1073327 RepID=A0A1M7ZB79_9BACT|nr:hypothetical protein [Algoriphagus zhangzhouensis]TDY46931.1 hypothetical protein A8938_1380 [Algoriphagus zhangzhouensis]SHO62110.1 hypothetical protein SAMN04488108_1882 [Algoriphagus zhangzhouensis]
MTRYSFYLLFNLILVSTSILARDIPEDSVKRGVTLQTIFEKDYGHSKASLEYVNFAALETKKDTSWLKIGGALRLNTIYAKYEGKTFPLGTEGRNDWTWDTWRINVDSYSDGLQFSFEYRFYPTFNTHFIKYGWIGYRFNTSTNLQFGITQVPFGLLTYASHSWWFMTPYYVGLEDDHQIGFNFTKDFKHWKFNVAYFLLSEPRGTNELSYGVASSARYSYDVVPIPGNSNIERRQINLRAARKLESGEIGLSLQTHEVYNQQTTHTGRQFATAIHFENNWGRWNLKTQALYYNFKNVWDDNNNELDVVQMGAYGFGTYDVAAEAAMYTIGIAYDIPVQWGPIRNIQLYNDYTYMQKMGKVEVNGQSQKFAPTHMHVPGALISAGKIYCYFDIARGINQPWLTDSFGGNSIGSGRGINYLEPISATNPIDQNPNWNTRLNINLGYYF